MSERVEHVHFRVMSCSCSIAGLEPAEDCRVHSYGEYPRRCDDCGKFMAVETIEPAKGEEG